MGREVLAHCRSTGVEPTAFIDRQAGRLHRVDDLAVVDLDAIDDASSSEVILALHSPGVDVADVARDLQARAFARVETLWALCDRSRWLPTSPFWMEPGFAWDAHADAIARARALFDDPKSVAVFDQLSSLHRHGAYDALDAPTVDDQYMPVDLPRWDEPMRLLDVGAFDGDTVRAFRRAGYAVERVVALEPDPDNHRALVDATAGDPSVVVIEAGAGSTNETRSFAAGGAGAAHFDAAGSSRIDVVRIDDVCADFHPTLIKMDVEGAEQDALDGAAATLYRDRPDLAISVYHRVQDLWSIPLALAGRLDRYRFALRSHAFNGFDAVLYARALR